MDEKTRGLIEKAIDMLLDREICKYVKWVEKEIPVSSVRDLMLGYAIGYLDTAATSVWVSCHGKKKVSAEVGNQVDKEIELIMKRRLPEILRKINRDLGV